MSDDWIPLPDEEPDFGEGPAEYYPPEQNEGASTNFNKSLKTESRSNANVPKQRNSRAKGDSFNSNRDEEKVSLGEHIVTTLRAVLSTTHEKTTDSVQALIERIMASTKVLKCLSEKDTETYEGVFEVLIHECGVTENGRINLNNLPVAVEYSTRTRVELSIIAGEAGMHNGDPYALWEATVEGVQRFTARVAASGFITAIDNKASVAKLMAAYKELEPPTTQKSLTRRQAAKTAKEISIEHKAALAGRTQIRFSSGLPTLDKGYTATGQVPGLVAPGELIMVMGPTGTGKSSFSYAITPAMTQDLHNYGFPDAKHVLFHTEEESIDKIDACRMLPGQSYAHLAEMVVVDAIGTSRQRIAMTLYDLVIEADQRARETKRPITDFLPYIVQLDYLQSIVEQGEDEKTATANTSELLLRGVCAWNPDEIAKFSGVDFREYAGMAWPEGQERHRVAVLAYAQLVKIDGDSERFRAGKSKLSDFAFFDKDDNPCWDVKEGDLRLFTKGQMRGSGVVANNAHAIIILHRSVPSPNSVDKSKTEANGVEHLEDIRARILFDKARAGTKIPYAPLSFDRQVDGPKAQYFDDLAEKAIEMGNLKKYDKRFYTGRGSMILPVRPTIDPFDALRY